MFGLKKGFLSSGGSKKELSEEENMKKLKSEAARKKLEEIRSNHLLGKQETKIDKVKAANLFNRNAEQIACFILDRNCSSFQLKSLDDGDRAKLLDFFGETTVSINRELFEYFHGGLAWVSYTFDRKDEKNNVKPCVCQLCYCFGTVQYSHIIQRSIHENAKGTAFHNATSRPLNTHAWWLLCTNCELFLNKNFENSWAKFWKINNLLDITSHVDTNSTEKINQNDVFQLACSLAWRSLAVELAPKIFFEDGDFDNDVLRVIVDGMYKSWFVLRDIFYNKSTVIPTDSIPRVYGCYFSSADRNYSNLFETNFGVADSEIYKFGVVASHGWINMFITMPLSALEHGMVLNSNNDLLTEIAPDLHVMFTIPKPDDRPKLTVYHPVYPTFQNLLESVENLQNVVSKNCSVHVAEIKHVADDDFSVDWKTRHFYSNLPNNWTIVAFSTNRDLFCRLLLPTQPDLRCVFAQHYDLDVARLARRFSAFVNPSQPSTVYLILEMAAELLFVNKNMDTTDMCAVVFSTAKDGVVKPPIFPFACFPQEDSDIQIDTSLWTDNYQGILEKYFMYIPKPEVGGSWQFITFPPNKWHVVNHFI